MNKKRLVNFPKLDPGQPMLELKRIDSKNNLF